ncbi:hypothetical protein LCL96_20275 [Rossellomorea aquimaris]|uniref:hypothetical protein n=1 Tax=Rossellomorea TaxID=2837508 RepID=UPI001CD32138|nr:hypothetical protein [Rossellomorea aquimaris]MCA1061260.1 hypothetical protein [Rossellomorea aquimaris]
MENPDRLISSFDEVELNNYKLPIICIYCSPKDYQGMYVARLFEVNQPTHTILMRPTLEAVRSEIPDRFSRVPKAQGEDSSIVETWI